MMMTTEDGTANVLLVPCAPGEIVDKITILEIKHERITEPTAKFNVERELTLLLAIMPEHESIAELQDQLKAVNIELWNVEDELRALDKQQDFGKQFIERARSVYRLNDKRAVLKREINILMDSAIVEEKLYTKYE